MAPWSSWPRRRARTGIDAEIIDLRSLRPLDLPTIVNSVKDRRCLIVHGATRTSGLGIRAAVAGAGALLHHLEAPIERVTGWGHAPTCAGMGLLPGAAPRSAAMRRALEP